MDLSSVGLHFVQEFLAVSLCQLIQWDMTESGDSVDIDVVFISLLRGGTDGWFAVVFVPVVDPVSEAHTGFDFEGSDLAVFCLELLQFFNALGLGFRQYAFCSWFAVFIVGHDVAAFPPSVCSQTDGALTILSFLCHELTPLP